MDPLNIRTALSDYPIYIHADFSNLKKAFEDAGLIRRKACIITDSNVAKLYYSPVSDIVSELSAETHCCVFEAGEEQKNLDTIQNFYRFFVENRIDRKSVVVALGGGVCGDMSGYAASTFMRGIDYVQIPTTLLSQVDSSVGGKVGVDFMGYKNMIGAFYQPRFVYINTLTLNSLPGMQFASGMGEVIKHGLIMDKQYHQFIVNNRENIKRLVTPFIETVVLGSCRIKSGVVSKDEKENGLREILNFGHTFGHAVESLSDFTLPHGHCVACGMAAALYISQKMGMISSDELRQTQELIEYFELPVQVEYSPEDVYNRMFMDKKVRNNRIGYVLLRNIGSAYRTYDIPEYLVMEAIRSICSY